MPKSPKTPPPAGAAGTADTKTPPDKNAGIAVVGLGASAGGLQAYSDFFDAMPADSGLAFVAIHHVDPNHESLMASLLAGHTAMPVALAQDRMEVKANHVYVIPPKRFLEIRDGVLHLIDPIEPRGLRLPIDHFLRSLALDRRERAIAIILSGTGSDGVAGTRAIKESGGLVLVQDPREALHDGMPRSAIASGLADQVLPVAGMSEAILKYASHPYIREAAPKKALDETARGALADIIALLRARSTVNFDLYKEGTLLRRIERRMVLRHMENANDYLALLRDQPEEVDLLFSDMLISVTSFFRDADSFAQLDETVIAELVDSHDAAHPIRIWVPACATGEEAYSLAMLVIERISAARKDIRLQIFASDVDNRALTAAREGVYPDAIEADVSAQRLKRFFVKEDHTYRVTAELRECIVFANQNVLADAPFSRIDLISCRNLLIYLNPEAQARIAQLFHFALTEGGYLFLGQAETVNGQEDLFKSLSKKHRIYQRIGMTRQQALDLPFAPRSTVAARGAMQDHAVTRPGRNLADLSQHVLVENYAPAAVLVNDRLVALYVHGQADRYLKVPLGEINNDILSMARDGLRASLGRAVRIAMQQGETVESAANVIREGKSVPITVKVHPVTVEGGRLYLATFTERPVTEPRAAGEEVAQDVSDHRQLELELERTRLDLKNTIRDFELSTEELKAANEEAMSMNEEFQSTNEELETSKEELQSLNEELTTLNAQLQQKVESEHRVSDDLNNLLESSGIATLFLDRQLNIMRFTPAMRDLYNVIAADVGRAFSDITGKIDDPRLLQDAQAVLDTLQPVEVEVRSNTGAWFIRRILPYRTQDGKIDGVVITFSNVTDLKALQDESATARAYSESIVDTIREPLLVLDSDFKVIGANRSFHRVFGTTSAMVREREFYSLQDGQWDVPELRLLMDRILPEKTTVESFELTMDLHGLGKRTMLINARRMERNNDGGKDLILLAIEDVTEQKRTERDLMEREARLSAIINTAPEAIITIDDKGIVSNFSPAGERVFGYSSDEMIGQNVKLLMPEHDRDRHDGYIARYLETGEAHIIGTGREMEARHKDGHEFPIRLTVAEVKIGGSTYFTGIVTDLTEEKKQRQSLHQAQKLEAVGRLTGGVAHDFNNLLTVITGNLELLDAQITETAQREALTDALEAATWGARLTRKLLTFSKAHPLDRRPVALNGLIEAMLPVLGRALGEDIRIATQLAPDLHNVVTDHGQVENALLNLVLNARDAMDNGGTVVIGTRNVTLDADYAATRADVSPGSYVCLSVSDTGKGIPREIIERVMEPFFTTKPKGQGTGLGLSMVYGFAKQSGGHAEIYSEPGQGTSVNIYLPAAQDSIRVAQTPKDATPQRGTELVLVAEDDPRVRRLTVARLESLGYKVIAVENGQDALDTIRARDDIALVLSDIVMPGGISGFDVAEQAQKIRPDLRIVLATGYANSGESEVSTHTILRKPYCIVELSQVLRAQLDAGPR